MCDTAFLMYSTDVKNVRFLKLSHAVLTPLSKGLSVFSHLIVGIILISAEKQMRGINAHWCITSVTHKFIRRTFSIMQKIRKPMRSEALASNAKHAVSRSLKSLPYPTLIGFHNIAKKTSPDLFCDHENSRIANFLISLGHTGCTSPNPPILAGMVAMKRVYCLGYFALAACLQYCIVKHLFSMSLENAVNRLRVSVDALAQAVFYFIIKIILRRYRDNEK